MDDHSRLIGSPKKYPGGKATFGQSRAHQFSSLWGNQGHLKTSAKDSQIDEILNSQDLLSPVWPTVAFLQTRSEPVSAHEVIAASLRAEWSSNKDLREQSMKDAAGSNCLRL